MNLASPGVQAIGSDARMGSITVPVGTRLACSLAAAVGFLLTVACFFPGYMSPDSANQLWQGRMMSFSDWHPPVMSFVWGLLDRIAPGPVGMLVLHNIMFWGGLALFVYHLSFERGWAAAAILVVGLSPPIFSLLSTIWKDVGMGCSLLLACGLLLRADCKRSKVAWATAFIPLWYGSSLRHNAIIAVIPLAIWAAIISQKLFISTVCTPWLSVGLRATLLVVLLALTSAGANRLLSQERSYPIQQILVHDLVGISLETKTVYLPQYLSEAVSSAGVSALEPLYTPDEVVPLFRPGALQLTWDPSNFSRLWAEWRSTVPQHLGAYISHRARVFTAEFGITRATVCTPYWDGIVPNALNLEFHPSALNRRVMEILSKHRDGPFFRGWLYLVAVVVLVSVFWLRFPHRRAAALLIGMSGLLYAIAYFFVSTTCDFRMHWWSVLTAFVLALLGLPSRLTAGRGRA